VAAHKRPQRQQEEAPPATQGGTGGQPKEGTTPARRGGRVKSGEREAHH